MAAVAAPSKRAVAQLFGRECGPEPFINGQAIVNLSSNVLNRNVLLARPLIGMNFIVRGRVVIAGANYTAVAAEAPQTWLERVQIYGNHRQFNQQMPIDISGSTAFVWPRLFGNKGNTLLFGTTLQAEPSVPFGQTLANFGNTGTYDLEAHYFVPTGPMLPAEVKRRGVAYYWYPEDWADTLQIRPYFGDQTSFGTPGGATTATFTAFGSGAGSPQFYAFPEYALLGQLAKSVQTALVIRSETRQVQGAVTAIGNALQLHNLAKQRTLNLMVKSGVNLTGVSAGVQVYASLSDTVLDRTQIIADNKQIRNNPANFVAKAYASRTFRTTIPQGYFLFTFMPAYDPLNMFRGDQVSPGGTFQLISDVVAANANTVVGLVQEQVFGDARAALQ